MTPQRPRSATPPPGLTPGPAPGTTADFAFMAEHVPAAFAMLGIRNETAGSVHGLHTSRFRLDEAALPLGAALHVQFARDFLAGAARGQHQRGDEL